MLVIVHIEERGVKIEKKEFLLGELWSIIEDETIKRFELKNMEYEIELPKERLPMINADKKRLEKFLKTY